MNAKNKRWIKVLSVILAAIMVLQILPLTVFANEKENKEALSPTLEETQTADIECELEEERDEFSKTYLLEDGTYATYVSKAAIHTKSDDGEWTDIAEIETPETMEELQSEISNTATVLSSDTSSTSPSVVTEWDEMTFQSIGNGLTGVGDDELRIQDYDGDNSQIRSVGYAKINNLNLPDLGDACIVTKATLGAYCSTLTGSENNIVIARTVEDEWPQANSQDHPLSESIMDYNAIDLDGEEYYEWDITEAACRWSDNSLENYGIALEANENDCKVSAYVDNIIMYYSVVNELDESYSFHSVDMGRAGTAYVNDFTNDFYLVRNELSLDGNIMPVSVTRTFNNAHKDDSNIAGIGWHFNNDSSLSKVSISRVRFFKWEQEDGSIKYFENKSGSWREQGVTEDEDGVFHGYTVTESSPYNIIGSEEDDYEYYYGQTSHQLEKIVNKNNKSIVFTYDDNYVLSNIADGIGRKFAFNLGKYGDDSFVNKMSVKDSADNAITLDGKELSLSYGYTNFADVKRLSSVTYADAKKVNYEYDDNGNMTVIRNIDGSSLKVNYNENGKVTSYTKYASDGETVLDKLIIDSNEAYQRIFTDKSDKTTRQQYDAQLNQISEITDTEGYFKEYNENNELKSISVTEEHTNLLSNSDFSDKLTGWNYPRNRGNEVVTDSDSGFKLSKYDNNVIKLSGKYSAVNYAKQTYLFNDDKEHKDEVYTAGVWAKVNGSIPRIDEHNNNRTRTVGVLLYGYTNGERGETTELLADITFDNSITDWQYMMVTFKLDKNYDGIQFVLSYNYQIGNVYFDGATLYKSTISDPGGKEPITTCPCENCTEPDCPCTCESEENCEHIWCKRGTTTVENEYGLTTKQTTTDAVTSMESTYTYDSNNYYLTQSTDENGSTVYYEYDSNTGKLTSMATGNKDNKINYTYNAVGLLKTVSQTVTNIITGEEVNMLSEYTYDGDTLSQINHNGSVYSFEYDKYGNVNNVKISGHSLAEYSYNNAEQIGYICYGNGDKINYTYDSNGNITSISTQKFDESNDELIEYLYTYSSDGALLSYTDNINETVTAYTDDGYTVFIPAPDNNSEDIIIYSTAESDNDNETTVDLFGYTFTRKKNIDIYDIETGQTTKSSKYTLPCEWLGITSTGESLTVNDYYGRNISSTFTMNTDDIVEDYDINVNQYDYILSNSYTYVAPEENLTTNLVESYTSSVKLKYTPNDNEISKIKASLENGELTQEDADKLYASFDQTIYSLKTSYKYDNAGRIAKIYSNDKLSATYKYDEAGQLTEEISENRATQYTYNAGGNITSKVYYDNIKFDEENDEFILGEVSKVTDYSYGINEWSDLLTGYNGIDIQYDSMGNPLNYQSTNYLGEAIDATFEWNGRLLTSLTINNEEGTEAKQKYEYSYNADGLRTRKVRYYWNDKTSSYEVHQIGEYIWENNILKGYRISYPGLKDDTTGAYNIYIVLPIYDENMEVIGVLYKTVMSDGSAPGEKNIPQNVLYFTKDAQGNIVHMYDPIGENEMSYEYDAYGKMLSMKLPKAEKRLEEMPTGTFAEVLAKVFAGIELTVAYSVFKEINPFAYRGYFYDGESGLYYNQSRYYSPEWCRFLNADEPMLTDTGTGTTNANNMFIYCENDPENYTDSMGYWAEKYSGFKWTSKGFDLNVQASFLSRYFCLIYSSDILRLKRTLFYKHMTLERMAVELYFHAIAYYATNTLLRIGITWNKIKSWNTSAKYMEINYDDKRVAYFYLVWNLGRIYF